MFNVVPVPAFQDNYLWLIQKPGSLDCAVVDPGDTAPVRRYIRENDLNLTSILITHHHRDHVGGMMDLKQEFGATIYGPAHDGIQGLDHTLEDGDIIQPEGLETDLEVIHIPGHTLGHIAYITPGYAFVGDTLFAAGCGRVFEGTMEQMHQSLNKLKALPDDTQIYCAHEYTLANLEFAHHADPDNKAIEQRLKEVTALRERDEITLPTTIALEKESNVFLRATSAEEFAALRETKDTF